MATAPLSRFILFGDSLTELSYGENGLAAQMGALYTRKLDVLNRGLSGYNTRWALPCLKEWLPKKDSSSPKTELMTIWLGANDSALPGEPQHVPLEEYTQNLRTILSLLRDPASEYHSPSTSFVLLTPPPLYRPDWIQTRISRGLAGYCDRTLENTRAYADAVIKLGKEEGIPVVDCYARIWDAAEHDEEKLQPFFTDGLHLTAKGYALIAEGVKQVIAEHYPSKHWEHLPLLFPYWRDIITGAMGPQFALSNVPDEQKAKGGAEPF
ncbi:hypothetical protein JCM10213_006395 [Rhodosporidiobolus nylandii]